MSVQQIEISGFRVEILRRAFQRSLKVTVKPNGRVLVTTGKGTPHREIIRFLSSQQEWLRKSMQRFQSLRDRYPSKQYLQGEGFLYRGQLHFLNFAPTLTGRRLRLELNENSRELCCWIPRAQWTSAYHVQPQPDVRPHLVRFYEAEGRRVLSERIEHWAEQMNQRPRAVSFRSQRTRWGSCSPEGKISLNWRLIAAPPEALDYVIIHELAHLEFLNHSARFWRLVETYSPKHRDLRQWLRAHQYEFDFLAKESELHPVNLLDT